MSASIAGSHAPFADRSIAETLAELAAIPRVDRSGASTIQHKIDDKTKPPGSLGQLETLALQIALIQGSPAPQILAPTMVVFAGDHGIAAQQVSPYPQAVTAQMVANFLRGGAAINALCNSARMACQIVDVGLAFPIPGADYDPEAATPAEEGAPSGTPIAAAHGATLWRAPIGSGTRDFSVGAAMTTEETLAALAVGRDTVARLAAAGCNTIGFGEMGIANTSAAACLMARYTGRALIDCVGRGTGLDDEGLAHKRAVLSEALACHADSLDSIKDPAMRGLQTLATFGGFEIAAMTGAFLGAAAHRMTIVVDGFVVSSALLAAMALAPQVRDYCIFSHMSQETGHRALLAELNAQPLLSLGLRLGEGTGAALALPLLRAACAFLNEMASFTSAGVDNRVA